MKKFFNIATLAALLVSFNTFAEATKTDCTAMSDAGRNQVKKVKTEETKSQEKKTKIQ